MDILFQKSGSCRFDIPQQSSVCLRPTLRADGGPPVSRHPLLKLFFISFFLVLFSPHVFSQDLSILQKIKTTPRLREQLQNWVHRVIAEWKGEYVSLELPLNPIFQKPLAVFITAKKGGEVRGCMGSLIPHEKNMAEEIRRNLKLAFTQDPRHRPIQKDEIKGMNIYVSALRKQELLTKPYQVNPFRDAIMIQSGSKQAVLLPGEAKTFRYLLAFLKAKAGIHQEPFQLYRMESETVELALDPSSPLQEEK